MATIINGYIKADELKKIDQDKLIKGKQGVRIPVTIKVNDESRYGNNVDIFVQQEPDEREAKKPRHYLGNASVIWTDGNVVKGQKDSEGGYSDPKTEKKQDDFDLPF